MSQIEGKSQGSVRTLCVLGLFLLQIPTAFSGETPVSRENTLRIADRRELFVDSYLIETMKNARLTLHHPRDEGIVLKFDKPWEGPFSAYCTVIRDGDTFRLYYRGVAMAGKDGNRDERTCYAESKDGIKWVKPELGLYEVKGSKRNNVILADQAPLSHNFSPFLDTRPDVPASQRFKALAGKHGSNQGLFAFASPDGIRWKKVQKKAVFTKGAFDSQNVAFWSESEKRYLMYFRSWSAGPFKGFRTVSRTTSKDFIKWTAPTRMTFGKRPLEHLYTNQTHPYLRAPHIYLAIAARFMPGRQVVTSTQAKELKIHARYFRDCSDCVLMTSRGGSVYDRTFMSSFVKPGIGARNWASRSNYPALNVVQTSPTEMSLYMNKEYAQPSAHLRRYSLGLDRFASVRAPYEGGELITKPLTFKGNRLLLNFSTSAAGSVRVEIQSPNGKPLPGYALRAARETIGDEIERACAWKEGEDLGALAGKPVRLRFVMKDADLFAFRFE